MHFTSTNSALNILLFFTSRICWICEQTLPSFWNSCLPEAFSITQNPVLQTDNSIFFYPLHNLLLTFVTHTSLISNNSQKKAYFISWVNNDLEGEKMSRPPKPTHPRRLNSLWMENKHQNQHPPTTIQMFPSIQLLIYRC